MSSAFELAQDSDKTPFDYIVVGSGAGGGPLAARLALGGKRVLLLEAGIDPDGESRGGEESPSTSRDGREVYRVPGYHAASTEEPEFSWHYSVRHYQDKTKQEGDSKYNSEYDPGPGRSRQGTTGEGGVLYPRASALGGCTAHHAMIIVKPDGHDWNRLAAITGDDSWGSGSMQGYFARIESCLYYNDYQGFFRSRLGWLYTGYRRLVSFINPRHHLDGGGHGFAGWQPTSFIDPILVLGIAWRDRTFKRVLRNVLFYVLLRRGPLEMLKRALRRLRVVQFVDPNFGFARSIDDPALALIPIGTDGKSRTGLREHLLKTAKEHPDRLVLQTEIHVTRVIFDHSTGSGPPRAIGVEACRGVHLYEPSPLRTRAPGERMRLFAKREIILCAGAFNTPQLLMLSGIGNAEHLRKIPPDAEGYRVVPIVDLPGVGRNLQDRYEVSVVSETDHEFSTLKNVSFEPGDPKDPARLEWLEGGKGLYATNGGALAIFLKSEHWRFAPEPDLFIFGFPAAFRGYYWGWSDQLLYKRKDAGTESRNLWSWVILKAHTQNNWGTVHLRSASPFDQPDINFRSFDEGPPQHVNDLKALAAGVEWVRGLNRKVRPFKTEIQPGSHISSGTPELDAWIRDEAWGHHACGTCRMGSDRWVARPTDDLKDKMAVLDSDFRVHGVTGLRVVDASIFPEIPGYFIVTPIFMASEKAADALLADSQTYPDELRAAEAAAIRLRRAAAGRPMPAGETVPDDAVGLALSGGGIRSATFSLGVLQALAAKKRIAGVDFLSTVSGGGYIGAFLGSLFTRLRHAVADKPGRVEETLTRLRSPEIWWLRKHANYLAGEGRSDHISNIGAIWRNLLAIHVCISALVVFVFAALRWISDVTFPSLSETTLLGVTLSPWWWVPPAIVLFALIPAWLGYWLAPPREVARDHPASAIYAWVAALGAAVAGLLMPGLEAFAACLLPVLLLAWPWQEAARWGIPTAAVSAQRSIVRNRLTRAIGKIIFVLVIAAVWVVLDTLARGAARSAMMMPTAMGMGIVAASLPLLRSLAMKLTAARSASSEVIARLTAPASAAVLAFVLTGFLLFGLDVFVHWAFDPSRSLGTWVVLSALIASLVLGRALGFLNASSLQALYSARLARAFLGASNKDRVDPDPAKAAAPEVQAAHVNDNIPFHRYHPEHRGGPLHLINVCINETVDAASGRQLRMDKGLSMCAGPVGVSVGRKFHAMWVASNEAQDGAQDEGQGDAQAGADVDPHGDERHVDIGPNESQGGANGDAPALRALPWNADPRAFHVLAQASGAPAPAEALPLSTWVSVSGAAFGTAAGRETSLPVSLLLGLFNIRLGYWWDSGISAGDRPGRYPPSLLRRIRGLFASIFRTQTTILDEWRARFPGPSHAFWYLTDGGHFEATGIYELIRRRLPLIICVDATWDPDYRFDSVALLTQRVRLDFDAAIQWIDPWQERQNGAKGWRAVDPGGAVPEWIREWIDPDRLGSLSTIKPGATNVATLARIDYRDTGAVGWLLLLKPTLIADPPLDVENYAARNPSFPNDSTYDQFLTDDQWESYRLLGEMIGRATIAARPKREQAGKAGFSHSTTPAYDRRAD